MVIYEPCNYVSNLAYYHVSTSMCDHNGNWNMDAESVRALGKKTILFRVHKSTSDYPKARPLLTWPWAPPSGTAATPWWATSSTTGSSRSCPGSSTRLGCRTCPTTTTPSSRTSSRLPGSHKYSFFIIFLQKSKNPSFPELARASTSPTN